MRKRIYIAEDIEDLRETVSEIYHNHGYGVEGFRNGELLLKRIHDGSEMPDLVVTDVWMPILDGIRVTKKLRRDARTRNIKIIAMSADAGSKQCLEAGADAHMEKPFGIEELISKTRMLLNQ